MTNQVSSVTEGTLIVRDGIALPPSVLLNSEPWAENWSRVLNFTPGNLDSEINDAGWTFFFMASPIETSVLGFDPLRSLNTAISRALVQMKAAGLNCLEIETIKRDTFLGFPRLSMKARRRHIQAGSRLTKG